MTKIAAGGIGVLILLLGIAGVMLKNLYEHVGELEQANAQLEQSLSESIDENEALRRENDRREQAVLRAKREREASERSREELQFQLSEALKNDPWADDRVPDAVIDSLQTGLGAERD